MADDVGYSPFPSLPGYQTVFVLKLNPLTDIPSPV
jgi:hypothetical protein